MAEISSTLPGWMAFHSALEDGDCLPVSGAAGVAILICPSFEGCADFDHVVFHPGRAHKLEITFNFASSALPPDFRTLSVFNVHNEDIPRNIVNDIVTSIRHSREANSQAPQSQATFIFGDFNFPARTEMAATLGKPQRGAHIIQPPPASGAHVAIWTLLFDELIELVQPHHTHFVVESLKLTKIDRGFTSLPGSLMIKLNAMATVTDAPDTLHYAGISDHAPVSVSLSPAGLQKSRTATISKCWCKTEQYATRLRLLLQLVCIDELPPTSRLKTLNACIWSAARHARDCIQFGDQDDKEGRRMVMESMARAVWRNDVRLARRLLSSSELARSFISVSDGKVAPLSFCAFEQIYASEKMSYLERVRSKLSLQVASAPLCRKKQLKSQIQAARRQQSIWFRSSRRLVLFGIRVSSSSEASEIISDPDGVQAALQEHWQPVYGTTGVDQDAAWKFLGVYKRQNGHKFNFDCLNLPDADDFKHIIKRAKNSAPGPNGIPYAAYVPIAEEASQIFADFYKFLSAAPVPVPGDDLFEFIGNFNLQNVCFAPKGSEAEDRVLPTRSPGNLRTVFLSNVDNKIVAAATNSVLIEPCLQVTPSIQRGFAPGRQFTVNIVVLDAFMRVFNDLSGFQSLCSPIGKCPVTALYDICNAFPTVAHIWLFAVLACIGLDRRIYRVIYLLYLNSQAYSLGMGNGSFLFSVLSGVRTGCPLSSTLFLLVFNPFIELMALVSDGPRLSRSAVCADDVGSALRALTGLKAQASIFQLAARVAGMCLKPSKCFLVVSVCELTPELENRIKDWLASNIPAWKDFKIVPAAKYLGVFIGRDSEQLTFKAPCDKYLERVEELASTGAPSLPTILRYNERVVTVFSYVSQVIRPPDWKSLASLEQRAVHKALKLPPNSMSRKLLHSFQDFCAKVPISLCASVRASMYRFARNEFAALMSISCEAREFLGDRLPLELIISCKIPQGRVPEAPILNRLLDAVHLDGDFRSFRCMANQGDGRWLLDYSLPIPAGPRNKLQAAAYAVFLSAEKCDDVPRELASKLCTTLGDEVAQTMRIPPNWFQSLISIFPSIRQHTCMCIFKTFVGGWTTSHRMHEPIKLPCIFGCPGESDCQRHYLLCAPLWQICGQALGCEVPIRLSQRLCLVNPSREGARLLALCFQTYHFTKSRLKDLGGWNHVGQARSQRIAFEAVRTFLNHV